MQAESTEPERRHYCNTVGKKIYQAGGLSMTEQKISRQRRVIPRPSAIAAWAMIFTCIVGYQNCSNVNFDATEQLLSEEAQQRMCPNGCIDGKLDSLENIDKPEVKVILVTDNSFSMTQSQEKLAVGVGSLIDRLKGFTSSYHLFTTTQEGDKQVTVKQRGCERRRDGVNELLPGTECPTGSSRVLGDIYSQFDSWSLAPSLTSGNQYRITESASEAEFSELKQRLATAIASPTSGVGTAGSDREQGLCTLARTVYAEGATKILNRGDVAVFTVISDENDFSDLNNCLSEVRSETNCTVEDTTPITSTITQSCTRPECASILTSYEVDLAARSSLVEKITYQRLKKPYSSRSVSYRTRALNTKTLSFVYEVAQPPRDGVPQSPLQQSGTTTLGNLATCDATEINQPCSTSEQISAATTRAIALGGTYKPNSCRITACTLTTPVTTPTKRVNAPNCNTLSLTQCESLMGNVSNYEAGSCSAPTDAANCVNVTPSTPENRTLSSREVTQARTGTNCTSSEIAAAQAAVGGDYTYVANSCSVATTSTDYPSLTKSYAIRHQATETEAQVKANSYCGSRIYMNGETLQQFASRTNNARPATACRIKTIGSVERSTETVVVNTPRPPGTPRCTIASPTNMSFPKTGNVPDLQTAFKQRADTLLGTNYFVSAIVHKDINNPNCRIQPGQSLGSKYIDLANASPGGQGVVASICDADYGVAFDDVSKWVVKSLENTYVIPNLKPGDEIISVWLVRGGQNISVDPRDFEINGQTLKIVRSEIMQPGDEIHYRIRLGM